MTEAKPDLPEFDNPPLIESVLGVQLEPLPDLDIPRIGLLWQRYKEHLPNIEQHPPLDPNIERLGARTDVTPRLQILEQPPMPRCWFLSDSGSELLQIQQDRLLWNWREADKDDVYPRYEETIRPHFLAHLSVFLEFLEEESVGEFKPNQCEVVYVNHILPNDEWSKHGEIEKIITTWTGHCKFDFPSEPENVRFQARHILTDKDGDFLGRLYIEVEPNIRRSDNFPMYALKLTARGRPLSYNLEGVLGFLDTGRMAIVKAFEQITTPAMHKIWGRIK